MRSPLPFGLALFLGLVLAGSSCTKQGTALHAQPTAPQPALVALEPQRGPAPVLPNPMLVTDSVHGGAFETCYQGFRPSGNVEKDLGQMTSMCGPPNAMKPVTPVIQDMQSRREAIARFTFRGEMGRCHRIFSLSERALQ